MRSTADPAAQLVQLADAEPVGVDHDHHGGVRYVDTDLDHGGADQNVDLAGPERGHHRVLLLGRKPPVHESESQPRQWPAAKLLKQSDHRDRHDAAPAALTPAALVLIALALIAGLVALIDAGRDDVGLSPRGNLLGDPLPGPLQPLRFLVDEDRVGGDRLPSAREFTKRRGLQIAEDRERDGARNRCRRHHQQVRR